MLDLTNKKQIPALPKGLVHPTIVAGINALGRGQDRGSLIQFVTTIAQTMGPQALAQYVNPDEAIKRLAAAQGIDILNLVKGMEQIKSEKDEAMQQQMQASLVQQAGQFASAPAMDPAKNPEAIEGIKTAMQGMTGQQQPPAQPPAN